MNTLTELNAIERAACRQAVDQAAELAALKAQRDELAEALKEYQDACGSLPGDGTIESYNMAYRKIAPAYDKARALLAKLEGGGK